MRNLDEILKLINSGRKKEALDAIEHTLSLGHTNIEALKIKAIIFSQEGRFKEASKIWEKILKFSGKFRKKSGKLWEKPWKFRVKSWTFLKKSWKFPWISEKLGKNPENFENLRSEMIRFLKEIAIVWLRILKNFRLRRALQSDNHFAYLLFWHKKHEYTVLKRFLQW